MKYCRFKLGDKTRHGLIETVDGVEMISCMLGVPPSETDPWGTIIPDFIPPELTTPSATAATDRRLAQGQWLIGSPLAPVTVGLRPRQKQRRSC